MPLALEANAQETLRILVIVAHPDDIEFGMAGSVARWVDHGAVVTYCIATDGGAGSNDPTIQREALVIQRQAEQRAAAHAVGVFDVRFLGYPDGTLQPTIDLRRDLTRLIREIRPHRVALMDPTTILVATGEFDYINHPDHRASGEAALYAVFPSAETRPIFPELLSEGLEPHHVSEVYLMLSDKPNIGVDISAYVERKVEALLHHRSQLGPEVLDMVRGWDTRAAAEVALEGVTHVETFRVMRFPVNVPAPIPPEPGTPTAEIV